MVKHKQKVVNIRRFGPAYILAAMAALFISTFHTTTACAAYDLGLITPEALNRDISAWIIFDARPKSQWDTGHLKGSRSFSWEEYTSTDEEKIPYRIWPSEKLAKALGEMGVTEQSPVVVYGDVDSSWGGEGWACWALIWLGHKGPVRLLQGGIQAWKSRGLDIAYGVEDNKTPPAVYHARARPEVDITTREIQEHGADMVLVDVRSSLEWFSGHIPQAVHITWTDFYSGRERTPISSDEMKKLLARHEIAPEKPVVYYCTGGVRSAYAWLVHQLSGFSLARNYEGGMEAWKRQSAR
jgi:thiosulfate/3-mercaptopyruvate sulfurtransferase